MKSTTTDPAREPITISPHEDTYPSSLRRLELPPTITVSAPLVFPSIRDRRVIAIVGSRSGSEGARDFAFALAYHLARADVVVVSGGAVGIDRAAHEGALRGGTTWVVGCTGRGVVFPESNADLFEEIEASSSSRMIWPFADGTVKTEITPRSRNKVLVALADCVVVIQACYRSGSRNAASLARALRRPVFVVPGMPWDAAYSGSVLEAIAGAEPLWSIEHFFHKLQLPPPDITDPRAARRGVLPSRTPVRRKRRGHQTFHEPPLFPLDLTALTREEKLVFSSLSMAPIQQDTIIAQVGLGASATLTALLTLSLKDVVVEGPDGFFRRRVAL